MRARLSRPARFAALAAIPLAFIAASPVASGVSYDFVLKTSTQGSNKETVTMRGRGVYAGDDARIEIVEARAEAGGSGAYGGKGSYFILKDAGNEMFLVEPAKKQYMKWDIASVLAGAGAVVNAMGGMVRMEMSDVTISAEEVGAGPTIQGYATRHYRMVQNYTISTRVLGRTSRNKSESTSDIYFAPTLRIANPFVSGSNQMGMAAQFDLFNNQSYKTQMEAAMAKLPKSGVPIRTVTTSVSTDDKGKAETTVSTMEMENIKAGDFPASTFAIPADYAQVEMPSLQMGDRAEEGKKGSAEGEKKESAGEAATKRLRGILGGKKN